MSPSTAPASSAPAASHRRGGAVGYTSPLDRLRRRLQCGEIRVPSDYADADGGLPQRLDHPCGGDQARQADRVAARQSRAARARPAWNSSGAAWRCSRRRSASGSTSSGSIRAASTRAGRPLHRQPRWSRCARPIARHAGGARGARRFRARLRRRLCEPQRTTLAYLSTDAVARDLDLIRAAVGDEGLTYLGFSYGTLIGALLRRAVPEEDPGDDARRRDRPRARSRDFRAGQAKGFEGALTRFLKDCAKRTACAFHGNGDSVKAFDALMASIDRDPIPAIRLQDPRVVGSGLAWYAVLGSIYSKSYWPILATALEQAKDGDGSLLLAISDPFRGASRTARIRTSRTRTTRNLPGLPGADGRSDVYGLGAPRAGRRPALREAGRLQRPDLRVLAVPAQGRPTWSAHRTRHRSSSSARRAIPATPYAWVEGAGGRARIQRLITREGEGHTGYADSTCVQERSTPTCSSSRAPKNGPPASRRAYGSRLIQTPPGPA